MNPEAQFRKYPPDYSNMRIDEVVFATLLDCYNTVQEYRMDILRPLRQAEPLPVIFFIHGGGFIQPNDRKQAYISYFAQKLLAAGYAVIAPDYPVYNTEADRDNAGDEHEQSLRVVPSIYAAREFLESNAKKYGLLPEKPVLMAGSAGGWASFAAVEKYPQDFSVLINLWGAPERVPNVLNFPPVFSVHGTDDFLVPYQREVELHRRLNEAGVSNVLYTIEGAGHTPVNKMSEYLPHILKFIKEHS